MCTFYLSSDRCPSQVHINPFKVDNVPAAHSKSPKTAKGPAAGEVQHKEAEQRVFSADEMEQRAKAEVFAASSSSLLQRQRDRVLVPETVR